MKDKTRDLTQCKMRCFDIEKHSEHYESTECIGLNTYYVVYITSDSLAAIILSIASLIRPFTRSDISWVLMP